MHLDEEQVQRLSLGELSPEMGATLREHVDGCDVCRARVASAALEAEHVFGLLRHLDHPVPSVDAEAVALRARRYDAHRMRWAASVLLVLGVTGVAVAAPGSPVRDWIRSALGSNPSREARPPAQAAKVSAPVLAGISVAPGEELLIRFTARQRTGSVRVSLTDATEIAVRASAGAATFSSGEGEIVIDNVGASDFEIQIPRTARRVEIRIDLFTVFLKEGSRITAEESPDANQVYVFSLDP